MVYIALGVVALIVLVGLFSYNRLVRMRQMTRNAWSDVDVYLKRRADLVPNLVASVQGYTGHEQATLEKVVDARNTALDAHSIGRRAEAEREVGAGVHQILMLAEAYPELRASTNFLELQKSLVDTERLIASARQYYNACVRDYNTLTEAFPSNAIANSMGFKSAEYFELEAPAEREAPRVQGLP